LDQCSSAYGDDRCLLVQGHYVYIEIHEQKIYNEKNKLTMNLNKDFMQKFNCVTSETLNLQPEEIIKSTKC